MPSTALERPPVSVSVTFAVPSLSRASASAMLRVGGSVMATVSVAGVAVMPFRKFAVPSPVGKVVAMKLKTTCPSPSSAAVHVAAASWVRSSPSMTPSPLASEKVISTPPAPPPSAKVLAKARVALAGTMSVLSSVPVTFTSSPVTALAGLAVTVSVARSLSVMVMTEVLLALSTVALS